LEIRVGRKEETNIYVLRDWLDGDGETRGHFHLG
jgi:hypothetical protein